jgi:hypothetical protein
MSLGHLSADTLSVHCDNFTTQHDQSLQQFKIISSQAFVPNSSVSPCKISLQPEFQNGRLITHFIRRETQNLSLASLDPKG